MGLTWPASGPAYVRVVGVGAACQPWIQTGKQSSLLTHIAATENVSLCVQLLLIIDLSWASLAYGYFYFLAETMADAPNARYSMLISEKLFAFRASVNSSIHMVSFRQMGSSWNAIPHSGCFHFP